MKTVRAGIATFFGLLAVLGCSGCLIVGYRGGHGGFIFPGGLGLVVVLLFVLFLLRRR